MSQLACDVNVFAPGRATVAAALRSFKTAPVSTTTRMLMVSPPNGVAAADTRCTVSGAVQRAWIPPLHWMRGKRLPDATSNTSECIGGELCVHPCQHIGGGGILGQ